MAFWNNLFRRNQVVEPPQTQVVNTGAFKRSVDNLADLSALSRLQYGWYANVSQASPNRRIERELPYYRNLSRMLADNDPLMAKYLELCANFVVGKHGLILEPKFRASKKVKDAWDKWCRDVSATGRLNLHDLSQQIVKMLARDGEVFIHFMPSPNGFKLYVRDAVLCEESFNGANGSNQIIQGVEYDGLTPVAYWLLPRYRDDVAVGKNNIERQRIPATNMLHLFDSENGGIQVRGMPWAQPVIKDIRDRHEFIDSFLVACRASAAMPLAIESKEDFAGDSAPSIHSDANPSNSANSQDPIDAFTIPGSVMIHLPYGKTLKSPDIKFAQVDPTSVLKGMDTRIATGLHVGYGALTGDMSDQNYASARHGSTYEKTFWENVQAFFARNFMQRVYEEWLKYMVYNDQLDIGASDIEEWYDVDWRGPAFKSGDPLKDAQALILLLANNIVTRDQICNTVGNKFEEIAIQNAKDKELLDSLGLPSQVSQPAKETVAAQAAPVDQGTTDTAAPVAPKETDNTTPDTTESEDVE